MIVFMNQGHRFILEKPGFILVKFGSILVKPGSHQVVAVARGARGN